MSSKAWLAARWFAKLRLNAQNEIEHLDLKEDINEVKDDVVDVRGDVTTSSTNLSSVQTNITDVRSDITDVRSDITTLRNDMNSLDSDLYYAELVVVAGGGGVSPNQYDDSAGAGGGGVVYTHIFIKPGATYTCFIGAGGAGNANGGNSSFSCHAEQVNYKAIGGGVGGHHRGDYANGGCASGMGGFYAASDNRIPGSCQASQGFPGGVPTTYRGGGGGGAGGAGTLYGNGGSGWHDPRFGGHYGAGGGGYPRSSNRLYGFGGRGGGGNASTGTGRGEHGGGGVGGGAGAGKGHGNNSNGGSGIIMVRYPGSARGSGGSITSNYGWTIHTFTSLGTFTG